MEEAARARTDPPLRVVAITAAFTLLGTAAVVVGAVDVVSAPTLLSQLFGLTYVVSGLVVVGASFAVIRLEGMAKSLGPVAGFGLAYVLGTLAIYSHAFQPARSIAFAVAAIACVIAGFVVARAPSWFPPRDGPGLSVGAHSPPKGAPASKDTDADDEQEKVKWLGPLQRSAAAVGVVITALQIWYANVYLPANVDVGITASVVAGNAQFASRGLRLVPVEIVVQNQSSVAALVLNSMYLVRGVRYPTRGLHWQSPAATLGSEQEVADAPFHGGLVSEQQNIVGLQRSAHAYEPLLAIGRLTGDGRILFPNVVWTTRIVVAAPPNVRAFEVHLQLDYARDTRLQLAGTNSATGDGGRPLAHWDFRFGGPATHAPHACRDRVIQARAVRESLVQRITRGNQVLVTDWCYEPGFERTWARVVADPARLTRPWARRLGGPTTADAYGIVHTQAVWTVPVG